MAALDTGEELTSEQAAGARWSMNAWRRLLDRVYIQDPEPVRTWWDAVWQLHRTRLDLSRVIGETEPEVERFVLVSKSDEAPSRRDERSTRSRWFRRR